MNDEQLNRQLRAMVENAASPLSQTEVVLRASSPIRKPRRDWHVTEHRLIVVAVAAAIVVVFFVPLPHASLFHRLSQSQNAASRGALTPAGWVPVADGDAELSVPSNWWVLYNVGCPTGSPPGEVVVNPTDAHCPPAMAGQGPKNVVWLVSRSYAGFRPSSSDGHRFINGFSVYDDSGTYFVPPLGLQVSLSGPLAQRVLHTLSHSPRSVALATGPAPSVPASWRKLTFQGLAFAAPAEWPVEHTPTYYRYFGPTMCPGMISNHVTPLVVLSTDKSFASCFTGASSLPVPRDGLEIVPTPRDGLEVASKLGKATVKALALVFSTRCSALNDLTVCPATSPAYSILVLKVTVTGRSKPVYVSIGLAGNGMIARTILYSLRAASRTTAKPTGVVTGVAYACSGLPPVVTGRQEVKVSLYSGSRPVASQTIRSGAKYRFSVHPGTYRLVGWWRSRAVTVRAGDVATVNILNLCR